MFECQPGHFPDVSSWESHVPGDHDISGGVGVAERTKWGDARGAERGHTLCGLLLLMLFLRSPTNQWPSRAYGSGLVPHSVRTRGPRPQVSPPLLVSSQAPGSEEQESLLVQLPQPGVALP